MREQETPEVCEECNGEGTVDVRVEASPASRTIELDCANCEGKGTEPRWTCHGCGDFFDWAGFTQPCRTHQITTNPPRPWCCDCAEDHEIEMATREIRQSIKARHRGEDQEST